MSHTGLIPMTGLSIWKAAAHMENFLESAAVEILAFQGSFLKEQIWQRSLLGLFGECLKDACVLDMSE